MLRSVLWATAGIGTAGALTLAYALYECTAYTVCRVEVPVLAPGADPLRILHISDLHTTPKQHGKFAWLSDLARLVPDAVVLTGDVLAHPDAHTPTLRALEPLFAFPGMFVPGNNDYYVPVLKSPHRYFTTKSTRVPKGPPLDWPAFAEALATESGWLDMTNTRTMVGLGGQIIDVRGVDDARLRRDRLRLVAGRPEPDTSLVLGLSHTPEPRVLDAFTADGVQLILSGHTHGGQVRLPFKGALVTNCGLDVARARGLSRHRAGGLTSWLHVSPGLGTSPYAPVRFNCRPEATLLALVPASGTSSTSSSTPPAHDGGS